MCTSEIHNQWYITKAWGTGLWCLCYSIQTIQGLFTPGKPIFCPANYRTLAYCIVWEAAFAFSKPQSGAGERVKPTRNEQNRTRLLFLAWAVFDLPLVMLCLFGGNGTIGENVAETRAKFITELILLILVHWILLRFGNPDLYWFVKYFSIPYDVYIVYMMQQTMKARGGTGSAEIALAAVKMVADILYLQPMVISWANLMTKNRLMMTYAKGLFTIVCTLATYFADVYLLVWTIYNDISFMY